MEKVPPEKKVKTTESQNQDSSKLDFLLDSIDDEINDLSDNMVNKDPMMSEPTSNGDGAALEHDSKTKITKNPDLDMDLFENTERPPADAKSEGKNTSAALDALSDAESEVNAMLAAERLAGDTEDPIDAATAEAEGDEAIIELTELLATREVDASKILEGAKGLTEAAVEPHAFDHELSKDLFPELAIEAESIEGDAGSEEPLMRWLNERDIKYRYVDVDKIPYAQKSKILDYLRETYDKRISYPYMVCDKKDVVVGYNPGEYEELMKGGGAA